MIDVPPLPTPAAAEVPLERVAPAERQASAQTSQATAANRATVAAIQKKPALTTSASRAQTAATNGAAEPKVAYLQLPRTIDESFRGEVPPPARSILYQLSFALVAMLVVLLPVIYLGLIFAVAAATVWWAITGVQVFSMTSSGRGAVLLYATPLAAGASLLPILVKPLFARLGDHEHEVGLDPQQEPVLFHFVHRICDAINAPRPQVIYLSHEVNASAGVRSIVDALRGRYVLTLGLPLIAALNGTHLASVVAHELGHFNQGISMYCELLVKRIQLWLLLAVHARDDWDEKLKEWSESDIHYVWILARTGRASIWLSRGIMWCLLYVSYALLAYHSRQSEFDADGAAARLVGSEAFCSESRELELLNLASFRVRNQQIYLGQDGWLVDNLPRLIAHERTTLEPDVLIDLEAVWASEKSALFSSHPTTWERIRRAKRLAMPGVFALDLPARLLLRDFNAAARAETMNLYAAWEVDVGAAKLVTAEQVIERMKRDDAKRVAAWRYLQDLELRDLILPDAPLSAPFTPAKHLETIKQARSRLVASREGLLALSGQRGQCLMRLGMLSREVAFFGAGMSQEFEDPETGTTYHSLEEITREMAVLRDRLRKLDARAATIGRVVGARLFAALQLVRHPRVAAALQEQEQDLSRWERLVTLARRLQGLMPLADELYIHAQGLRSLLSLMHEHQETFAQAAEENPEYGNAWKNMERERSTICARILQIYARLSEASQDLRREAGSDAEAGYGVAAEPDTEEAAYDAELVRQHLLRLYEDAITELVDVASVVEHALSLPKLPEPGTPIRNAQAASVAS